MANDVLTTLVRLSVVGTLGILVVGPLRALARRAVGAEATFWLWLLLPASLIAVLLPRAPDCLCRPEKLVAPLLIRSIAAPLDFAPSTAVIHFAPIITAIWAIGATVAAIYFTYCQQELMRSLGIRQRPLDGTLRSSAAKQPMVIGVWRPQVVLPCDFKTRYSASERVVILAHERAHLVRHDALTNSLAVAILCLFWFHPLMYWAWNRFRFDQETACDAAVLRKKGIARRCYARALVKTQITTSAAIAFGLRGRHPLLERIALLGRPVPNPTRRLAGYSLAVVLMLCGTYVVWAAQPDLTAPVVDTHPCIVASTRRCKITPNFMNAGIREIGRAVELTM